MAARNYEDLLAKLLNHEGGYVDHPSDPGGETNYGITKGVAIANGYTGDMRAIPMEVVQAIYRKRYWDALKGDDLPSGVDYAVFDYGVNSGIGRSAKVLQRVVGVADDGVIGPKTMAAVLAADPAQVVRDICDERLAFLKRLRTWPVFGKGWGRRVAEVKEHSLALVKEN